MDDEKIAIVFPTMVLGCALLGGIILCVICGRYGSYVGPFLAGAICGGLLGCSIWSFVYNTAEKKRAKEQMQAQLRITSSGKWKFPTDDFYKQCINEKATDETDKLDFKKMMLVAKNIIVANGIPQEYVHLYYNEEKVKYYFKTGKENVVENEKLKKITPQPAKLTDEMIEICNLHYALRNELYAAKRKLHLEILIRNAEKRIQKYKESKDAIFKTMVALNNSTKKSKNDWAVIGGLAQGIAGPAAGAVAASQAISENERIDYENKQNEAAIVKQWLPLVTASDDKYRPMISKQEKIIKHCRNTLEKLPLKLYFTEYDKSELFKQLEISGSVSKPNNESAAVTISITNNYYPGTDDYTIVMDGIIKTKLYCEDIFVDEFFIALPENGIAYNEKAVIIQYPKKYMIGENRKYRFEFSPHSLWLMER